jgi:hypothetical protein
MLNVKSVVKWLVNVFVQKMNPPLNGGVFYFTLCKGFTLHFAKHDPPFYLDPNFVSGISGKIFEKSVINYYLCLMENKYTFLVTVTGRKDELDYLENVLKLNQMGSGQDEVGVSLTYNIDSFERSGGVLYMNLSGVDTYDIPDLLTELYGLLFYKYENEDLHFVGKYHNQDYSELGVFDVDIDGYEEETCENDIKESYSEENGGDYWTEILNPLYEQLYERLENPFFEEDDE